MRQVLSVIAGLVAAIIIFVIVETSNHSMHPDAFKAETPTSFWLMVLLGWGIGAILCGAIIKKIAQTDKKLLPIIAGVILTLSAVANFTMFPHPIWVIVCGLVMFVPLALMGHRMVALPK